MTLSSARYARPEICKSRILRYVLLWCRRSDNYMTKTIGALERYREENTTRRRLAGSSLLVQ